MFGRTRPIAQRSDRELVIDRRVLAGVSLVPEAGFVIALIVRNWMYVAGLTPVVVLLVVAQVGMFVSVRRELRRLAAA